EEDVHVALLVSNPRLSTLRIDDPVETRQIACTVAKALDIDCDGLQSQQTEHSKALPLKKGSGGGNSLQSVPGEVRHARAKLARAQSARSLGSRDPRCAPP